MQTQLHPHVIVWPRKPHREQHWQALLVSDRMPTKTAAAQPRTVTGCSLHARQSGPHACYHTKLPWLVVSSCQCISKHRSPGRLQHAEWAMLDESKCEPPHEDRLGYREGEQHIQPSLVAVSHFGAFVRQYLHFESSDQEESK